MKHLRIVSGLLASIWVQDIFTKRVYTLTEWDNFYLLSGTTYVLVDGSSTFELQNPEDAKSFESVL